MLAGGDAAVTDRLVDAAASRGAAVRGRALLPYVDEHGQLRSAGSADELAAWRAAAVALARRWAGRIGCWELVPPLPGLALGDVHVAQIVDTAVAVKDACPDVDLVLNPGEMFAPRMTPPGSPATARRIAGPVPMAVRCLAAAPGIDALALAAWWPNCDLLQLSRLIDVAASCGRPVELLCLAAPSLWQDDPRADPSRGRVGYARSLGFWRQPWTPDVQAEYAAGLLALADAHPAVRLVEWIDFSDAEPHTFPFGGLLDGDGRAKPLHGRFAAVRAGDFPADRPWAEEL
jgi:hypothetical protein